MKIKPLYPLIFPLILVVVIVSTALLLPSLKPVDDAVITVVAATPDNWFRAVQLITIIGEVYSLVAVALLVAGWEVFRRHYVRALVMMGSLLSLPAFYVIKEVVHRARPVTEYIAQHGIHGYSFPSGHATGTFAVYGMIAYLIASHTKGITRALGVSACAVIILLVGFTRIYLGVHFPTDVFAGWLLGLTVLSLLRSLSLYLAKRSDRPNREAVKDSTEAPESLEG